MTPFSQDSNYLVSGKYQIVFLTLQIEGTFRFEIRNRKGHSLLISDYQSPKSIHVETLLLVLKDQFLSEGLSSSFIELFKTFQSHHRMYRKSQLEIMENNTNNSYYSNTVQSSQFLSRLVKIPLVSSAITVASNVYGRAKNSGGFFGTTLTVAEKTCAAAAGQVLPYAQKLTPIAAQPLTKVDDFANKGLEKLESKVPVIMKRPDEIVSETKEMISSRVTPAVQRLSSFSSLILGTKVATMSMGLVDSCLNVWSSVLNTLLPPPEGEKENGTNSTNGHFEGNSGGTSSLGYLFHKTVYLGSVTLRRVLGLAQARVDSAVSARDNMVNSARKSLNNILPSEKQTNGEVKKKSKKVQ